MVDLAKNEELVGWNLRIGLCKLSPVDVKSE